MPKLKPWEWGALAVLAFLLIVFVANKHATCAGCQERFAAMMGAWPGAGPGVAATPAGAAGNANASYAAQAGT